MEIQLRLKRSNYASTEVLKYLSDIEASGYLS